MSDSRYFKSICHFWKILPNGDQIMITGYDSCLSIQWLQNFEGITLPDEDQEGSELPNVEVFGPEQAEDFEAKYDKATIDLYKKAFPKDAEAISPIPGFEGTDEQLAGLTIKTD